MPSAASTTSSSSTLPYYTLTITYTAEDNSTTSTTSTPVSTSSLPFYTLTITYPDREVLPASTSSSNISQPVASSNTTSNTTYYASTGSAYTSTSISSYGAVNSSTYQATAPTSLNTTTPISSTSSSNTSSNSTRFPYSAFTITLPTAYPTFTAETSNATKTSLTYLSVMSSSSVYLVLGGTGGPRLLTSGLSAPYANSSTTTFAGPSAPSAPSASAMRPTAHNASSPYPTVSRPTSALAPPPSPSVSNAYPSYQTCDLAAPEVLTFTEEWVTTTLLTILTSTTGVVTLTPSCW
ncbi:MAG: hypothetical protein M1819_001296 [Sarea resinae]|nr:MAG: hypothetical protein M1819_001296 [Sarea resinae]